MSRWSLVVYVPGLRPSPVEGPIPWPDRLGPGRVDYVGSPRPSGQSPAVAEVRATMMEMLPPDAVTE